MVRHRVDPVADGVSKRDHHLTALADDRAISDLLANVLAEIAVRKRAARPSVPVVDEVIKKALHDVDPMIEIVVAQAVIVTRDLNDRLDETLEDRPC